MSEFHLEPDMEAEIEYDAVENVWENKLVSFAYVGIAAAVSYALIASFALLQG